MILIKNAKILSMCGQDYENGCVLINDQGTIEEVAETIEGGAETVLDAEGAYLCPGFIDAHCHVGIFDDRIGFAGSDGNELTDPTTPQMRAIDGINPFDTCFEEALQGGVTTLCTGPGSGNVIGGQFVLLKNRRTARIEERILKEPAAMKVAFGENPKNIYHERHRMPTTRMGVAAILRETFYKARDYIRKREEAEKNGTSMPDYDLAMETVRLVLERKMPMKVHVHRADDIMTAIRIAKEFDIEYTLDHCTEGYLIPEVLQECGARGVIIGPLLNHHSKNEIRNNSFKGAKVLYEAGILFAIMTDASVIPIQYLPFEAALCVKEGLPEEEALKAITINPARILGVDDRLGSIEKGKDADLALFDAHPLDPRCHTKAVFVDGKLMVDNGAKIYRA